MSHSAMPNNLINSSSPYLQQHAHNPVRWYPWGEEALQKAREEDKPIIISIGYSACHWCHVMERESFENQEIAELMNEGFVCIKIDREERPDIDQVYMEAIQAMGINGGWPLNVFTLPDQRPFYGGTYFQPRQWTHILKSIMKAYQEQRDKLVDSASGFTRALAMSDTEKYRLDSQGIMIDESRLGRMVEALMEHVDLEKGGLKGAPKFPNPGIWRFLLVANVILKREDLQDAVMLALDKMAAGGIYDQVGGGFARYSVDDRWFAPHFEKMLYDNGQLLSLYSYAYQITGKRRYEEVIKETVGFVERELTSPEFGFYSALDADSEGKEGSFYIWESAELDDLLSDDAEIIRSYYGILEDGNWEGGQNILHTTVSEEQFASLKGIRTDAFRAKLNSARKRLLERRAKRERPGLDDKILAGWNGLMLKGLIDAYNALGEEKYLTLALKNASFIRDRMMNEGRLQRSQSEKMPGYLEDYALVIEAFFAVYQVTFDQEWLDCCILLTNRAIGNFYDDEEELFYFTDKDAEALIARKKEIFDNVIPASNSVMAQNLFLLGKLLENERYQAISEKMISKMTTLLMKEPRYVANWGTLYTLLNRPMAEIAIVGEQHRTIAREIQRQFRPHIVLAASEDEGDLPILQNRNAIDGKTTLYVCFNKSCKLPVFSVKEALEQLDQ